MPVFNQIKETGYKNVARVEKGNPGTTGMTTTCRVEELGEEVVFLSQGPGKPSGDVEGEGI